MSYFSLRKHGPEPVDEDLDEEEFKDDEPVEEQPAGQEPGTVGALVCGISGPGAWIAARFGTGAAWSVHIVAVWACGFYGGWVAVGVVVTWLGGVLAFVPREHKDRATAWIERRTTGHTSAKAEQETAEEAPSDPLVTVLWQLIANAPGVHVKTLAEHLQAAATEGGVDRAAVRAKLAARGIPTRPSVRDASGRVNEGVHRRDLEAWQQALPDHSPAPAPEARSRPVEAAVTCDVADAPTPVATPPSKLRGLLSRGVT